MAKRKVVFRESQEKPQTVVLDSLELIEVGSRVRFRHREDQGWTKGKVTGESKDGSISVYDQSGKCRSVMPRGVEAEITGPRGGKKYVPVIES